MIGGGWFGPWVRGGLVSALVLLMAAVSAGAVGTPAWATVGHPGLSIQQDDNEDEDNGDESEPGIVLTVNSTLDEIDANPGDGVCASAANRCTLRAAVMEANLRGGRHTIVLPSGTITLTIPTLNGPGDNGELDDENPAAGDLNIQTDLSILGQGTNSTVVSGGNVSRIFHIEAGRSANLRNFRMSGGSSQEHGGAIFSLGRLLLVDAVLSGNHSNREGGAIYAINNSLEVIRVRFEGNSAESGGAIYATDLEMADSVVTGNTAAAQGGGLAGGRLSLASSTVSSNIATSSTSQGGGISSASVVTLNQVTIDGNTARNGAGLWGSSKVSLINVTLSGNSASGDGVSTGLGGGLYFNGSLDESSLTNVTVANNSAPRGSGIYKASGDLQIRNTVVAANGGGTDCFRAGAIISLGNNIDGGSGCGFLLPSDRQNTNPMLAPLSDNGGSTRTHSLLAGSPAIDGGTNTGCPSTDQRGIQRPRDGNADNLFACDIGAFESAGPLAPQPPDNQESDNSPEPTPPDNDEGGGDNIGPPGVPGETTVDFQACPGTTWVGVRTLTGFAIGQTVRINPGGPTQEDAQVVDVGCNGRNLHLAGPLRFRHRAGESVVVVAQGQAATTVNPPNNDGDRERTQSQRRTEQQRQQSEQTNRSGRDDVHSEGDVSAIDLGKQPPEITILTRDGPQTVQLLCGGQCPTIKVGDYVELDGAKQHEGLFAADTVTVTRR